MALEIKVGILNNKDNIIITEDTGNYNAVSNPGGWGAPNPDYTIATFGTGAKTSSSIDTGTERITSASHGFTALQQVVYTTSGTTIGGLTSGQRYFILSPTTNDFQLSSDGATAVNLTSAGTGTHTFTPATNISLDIYLPGTTTSIGVSTLLGTTYFSSTDRAYNLFTDLSAVVPTFTLQDGVWKYIVTYNISGVPYVITKYALRDNTIRCLIGQLALGDMDANNYEEVKLLYDKMVQAFECEEYVLAQELYEEINDALTDCSPYSSNCNC
jgi:hypothetical protein